MKTAILTSTLYSFSLIYLIAIIANLIVIGMGTIGQNIEKAIKFEKQISGFYE